jgi:hypothetical protein
MDNKPISSSDDYIELAKRFADKAMERTPG